MWFSFGDTESIFQNLQQTPNIDSIHLIRSCEIQMIIITVKKYLNAFIKIDKCRDFCSIF